MSIRLLDHILYVLDYHKDEFRVLSKVARMGIEAIQHDVGIALKDEIAKESKRITAAVARTDLLLAKKAKKKAKKKVIKKVQ